MAEARGTQSLPGAPAQPASVEPDTKPHEGLRLGRYELLLPIARGGMAEVWIARFLGDLGLSRIVALKTIRPDYATNPSFRTAFLDEARIAARLSHVNVLPVLDLGERGDILFQVMTLVEGGSVATLLRRYHEWVGAPETKRGLPIPIAIRIIADALGGLHSAHRVTDERGTPLHLVHRDVSPQNILVGIDGVARVADFGVAKSLGRLVEVTQIGQVRGKLGYLSPEQLEGRTIGPGTDVFSAGIVLWEMLTGARLYRDDVVPSLADIRSSALRDPRETNKEVTEGLARVVLRALAYEPKDRFLTAEEMSSALEHASPGLAATPAAVGRFVTAMCRQRIAEQRDQLRKMSGGPAELGADLPSFMDWSEDEFGAHEQTTITQRHEVPPEIAMAVAAVENNTAPITPARRIRFWPSLALLGAGVLFGLAATRLGAPPEPTEPARAPDLALSKSAPPEEAIPEPSPSTTATSTVQAAVSSPEPNGVSNTKTSPPAKRHLRPKFGNPYLR
jgi:eukaryotic-like serine/threonine-protein kinase